MIEHNDAKIADMVRYFMQGTNKVMCVNKLFKLFYYADFMHYKETCRSITGMKYTAMNYAPVPDEIKNISYKTMLLKKSQQFDGKYFTKREFRIIEGVSIFFDAVNNNDMVGIYYLGTLPWENTEKGQEIDYKLVLDENPIVRDEAIAREKYKAEIKIMFS